ncbi:MAG: hypothetical protein AB1558_02465 [Thermodesulfobacteriota bacterium]
MLRKASVRETIDKLGLEIVASSPGEFTASVTEEVQKWIKLVKEAGISPE